MADEVTDTEVRDTETKSEDKDYSFQGDNLHDIQASNASYLYDNLRIPEILKRLDRLESERGLEPVEVEPVIQGQPAWAREVYLKENEVLPIFPGPDNSTPVYVEDEAAFRERIANVENKPVGLKPEDREDEEEQPTTYDTDEPREEGDGEADPAIKEPATVEENTPEEDPKPDEKGEQLSLFDEQGNLREEHAE